MDNHYIIKSGVQIYKDMCYKCIIKLLQNLYIMHYIDLK